MPGCLKSGYDGGSNILTASSLQDEVLEVPFRLSRLVHLFSFLSSALNLTTQTLKEN